MARAEAADAPPSARAEAAAAAAADVVAAAEAAAVAAAEAAAGGGGAFSTVLANFYAAGESVGDTVGHGVAAAGESVAMTMHEVASVGESISSRLSLSWLSPGPPNALVPAPRAASGEGGGGGYGGGHGDDDVSGERVGGLHVSDFAFDHTPLPPREPSHGGGDSLLARLGSGLGGVGEQLGHAQLGSNPMHQRPLPDAHMLPFYVRAAAPVYPGCNTMPAGSSARDSAAPLSRPQSRPPM